jgi:hypothetical protein
VPKPPPTQTQTKKKIASHKHKEMEGTKRSHEAGPSSVTIDKTKQQITQKSTHTFHDSSDEDEEEIIDHSKKGVFVPGPLLSLKEQIEKDKVLFLFYVLKISIIFHSAIFFLSPFEIVGWRKDWIFLGFFFLKYFKWNAQIKWWKRKIKNFF